MALTRVLWAIVIHHHLGVKTYKWRLWVYGRGVVRTSGTLSDSTRNHDRPAAAGWHGGLHLNVHSLRLVSSSCFGNVPPSPIYWRP